MRELLINAAFVALAAPALAVLLIIVAASVTAQADRYNVQMEQWR